MGAIAAWQTLLSLLTLLTASTATRSASPSVPSLATPTPSAAAPWMPTSWSSMLVSARALQSKLDTATLIHMYTLAADAHHAALVLTLVCVQHCPLASFPINIPSSMAYSSPAAAAT